MYSSKYGEHDSSIRSCSFRKTARRIRKTFASVWTRGIGCPLLFGIAFNGSYSDVDLWHSEISGIERCSTAARRYNVSDYGVLYDDLIYIGFFRAGSGISTIWRIEKSTRARQRENAHAFVHCSVSNKFVRVTRDTKEAVYKTNTVSRTANTWSYLLFYATWRNILILESRTRK